MNLRHMKTFCRYGELEISLINLVIKESTDDPTEPTLASESTSTDAPMQIPSATPSAVHNTTVNPVTEMQEYQRQFFFLKVPALIHFSTSQCSYAFKRL